MGEKTAVFENILPHDFPTIYPTIFEAERGIEAKKRRFLA